jgi:hypothetical protein
MRIKDSGYLVHGTLCSTNQMKYVKGEKIHGGAEVCAFTTSTAELL